MDTPKADTPNARKDSMAASGNSELSAMIHVPAGKYQRQRDIMTKFRSMQLALKVEIHTGDLTCFDSPSPYYVGSVDY